MENYKKLAVVVLFWNDYKKTIKCLKSIYSQKKINFSLVLVDNNSKLFYCKKIFEFLKKNKIKILKTDRYKINKSNFRSNNVCFYIKNNKNYGCGLGHNYGYQFSLKNNFKYIARIDNDMILPNNLLYNLTNRIESNRKILALSPKVMFVKNPNLIWFRGAKIGNNLKFQKQCSQYKPGHLDRKEFKGLVKTDAIVGCASIMRSKDLKKSGLSDPDFFYGEEDIELSYRLKKDYRNHYVDLDEKIFHHVSGTVGKNWAKNIYYNFKYRLVLIKKIGTVSDKIIGYSMYVIKLILSVFLLFQKKHSSRIIQRFLGLKHFIEKNYGSYDRENYKKVDKLFRNINKETSMFQIYKYFLRK